MAEDVVRWQGTEELDCWNRFSIGVSDGIWEKGPIFPFMAENTSLDYLASMKLKDPDMSNLFTEKERWNTEKENNSGYELKVLREK